MTDIEQFNIFLDFLSILRVSFILSVLAVRGLEPGRTGQQDQLQRQQLHCGHHQGVLTRLQVSHVACHAGLSCHSVGLNLAHIMIHGKDSKLVTNDRVLD